MPTNPQVTLTSGTLPSGFCPSNEQERFNEYVKRTTGQLPGSYSTIVFQNAKPGVVDQDKLWMRTNADGTLDRAYTFSNGIWRSPHAVPTNFTWLYWGAITDVDSLDGGSAGTVTATSGPFWAEVTEARGRFPVHPDPNKVLLTTPISVKGTGGEETHTLVPGALPDHVHQLKGSDLAINYGSGTLAAAFLKRDVAITSVVETTADSGGNGKPHNNMPPYIGLYLLRRTPRLYYIIP